MTEPDTPRIPTAAPSPPDSTPAPPIDPEDWESTPADEDERYQQERPPHWE